MNEDKDSNYKKVTYHLQQMAFQKYPFEINGKTFFCLQSYFEDQLLNGVDLEIKQCKGINQNIKKITYLSQTQQLVLAIGSNIATYNTQKRVYNILTSIEGYVEIIKTYNCRINDKIYIYWLQSDEEGLNQKVVQENKDKLTNTKQQPQTTKITSIWNLFSPGKLCLRKQASTKMQTNESQKNIQKRIRFQQTSECKVQEQLIEKIEQKSQKNVKNKKTVRIIAPHSALQQKKRMRICIYDYEKKAIMHKQPIQIPVHQSVHDIIVYLTSQKIVGYVINKKQQEKSKIYYRRFKINDLLCTIRNGLTKKSIKNNQIFKKTAQKFKVLESLFMIEQLKYNGQTDMYNVKDHNVVYSLQFQQDEYEIEANINHPNVSSYKKMSSRKRLQQQQQTRKNQQESRRSIYSSSSIQSNGTQLLNQQIQKVTRQLMSTQSLGPSQSKLKLKISEQIELLTEQVIIDFSMSQTYMALITNEFIRFYSIFNLNTLLFKVPLVDIQDFPIPTSIQINKSYILITHDKTTLVSSYSILQRKLKYNSTCQVQIQHCSGIKKLFMNQYNCEVAVLADQYQIQGRMTNLVKSKKIIQTSIAGYRKNYVDLSLAYINCSSTKCESKPLFLKGQSFRNLLICQWNSQYLIETQNEIQGKEWRQSFQNLKCSCLHPTGQYLIIGFNDCFKIYIVTFQGLQNTYMSDGVKDCQSIAYSQYGQHFAVGSANSVGIYNSYSAKKIYTIVLPVGSIVQSLQYKNTHLICILKTKRLIVYHSLLGYKEIFSFNPKNYLNQNKVHTKKKEEIMNNLLSLALQGTIANEVNSIFYDLEFSVIIFSSNKKVYVLNVLTNQTLGSYDFANITCMEYNKHLATLFFGTQTGQLIAFPWPNKPSNVLADIPTFKFHSSKITKIKITSDYKHLITLGEDKSMYKNNISYVLNLKRLKGQQLIQHKGNHSLMTSCNFLTSKGYCQFTHFQDVQKFQNKKQLQEQVVNILFMLPEQRHKQKQHIFDNISETKETLNTFNIKQQEPLQKEIVQLRNKILRTKEDLIRNKKEFQKNYLTQRQKYEKQSSNALKICYQLNHQSRQMQIQLRENYQKQKYYLQKSLKKFIKDQEQEYQSKIYQVQRVEDHKVHTLNKFHEIPLIQQEKSKFLQQYLTPFQQQISAINSINSQISSKNSKLQKQILVLKRKIQDLKFVKMNAQNSVQKLKAKNSVQEKQKSLFEKLLFQNAKIDVSQMQKKYIKATKSLIQKNKEIDIKLTQYQKEKQILVTLEKTVQNTENQIDHVVDSLRGEKQFMKQIIQKIQANHARIKKLTKKYGQKKIVRSNIKTERNILIRLSNKLLISYQQSLSKNQIRQGFKEYDFKEQINKKILKVNLEQNQTSNIKVDIKQKKGALIIDENQNQTKKISNLPLMQLFGLKKGKKKDETSNFNQTFANKSKKNTYISKTVRTLPNQLPQSSDKSQLDVNSSLTNRKSYQKLNRNGSSQQNLFGPHVNSLQKKQQYVIKRISTQQKLMNKIKTDQNLYVSVKNRLLNQNQDLLVAFNSLSYDNKYFNNILKAYDTNLDQQDKQIIQHQLKPFSVKKQFKTMTNNFSNSKKTIEKKIKNQNQKQKLKATPFQLYVQHNEKKLKKRTTRDSCNISTSTNFFTQKKQLKKKGKWAQSRLHTLPCVQLQFGKI